MFKIRSIDELLADYIAALSETSSETLNLSPSSPLYALARANASIINDQELRLNEFLSSSSILTAAGSDLDRLTNNIVERGTSSYAQGNILILPTSEDIYIPLDTVLTDLSSGLQFVSTTAVTTSKFVNTSISVQAADRGSAYNLSAGSKLFSSSFSQIKFIVATAKLSDGSYEGSLSGGRDEEDDASIRERLLARLLLSNQPTSKAFLRQVLLAYPSVTRAYVKTRVGGIVEVWVNTVDGFTNEELVELRDYIVSLCPAGIVVAVNNARVRTFDISIKVVPYKSSTSNLSALTQHISNALNSYVGSLDIADRIPLSRIRELVSPLVQSLTILEPSSDLVVEPDQILTLSSLNISYPG